MRVFVAGGNGVLGRRVLPALVAEGHEVTAVVRGPDRAGAVRDVGATPATVDLFDAEGVRSAVAGHDAVVNLATRIPPTSQLWRRRAWADNDRLRRSAARHLADGAVAAGAARYVQESLTFPYVDGGERWLDEDQPVAPDARTASTRDAEAAAARVTDAGGAGVVLRFSQLVAPDSGHLRDHVQLARRGWLLLLGAHEGYESFVDADDAAAAVVAALAAPAGVYNVSDDEPLRRREHAAVLSELVGRPVRLPPAAAGSLPAARVRARSQRVGNRRLVEATGWRPRRTSMRDGWPQLLAAQGGPPR